MPDTTTTKPTSRYELKRRTPIEATHPHTPAVAWCLKCKSDGSIPPTLAEAQVDLIERLVLGKGASECN